MGRRLRKDVYIDHVCHAAGTAEADLPSHVRISNPKAWHDHEDGPEEDTGSDTLHVPARAGRGSSVANWTAYAVAFGLDVPEGATRDDVIAALEAEGIATK